LLFGAYRINPVNFAWKKQRVKLKGHHSVKADIHFRDNFFDGQVLA
jgi:hypothetical protein